jgi:hypothetical protein
MPDALGDGRLLLHPPWVVWCATYDRDQEVQVRTKGEAERLLRGDGRRKRRDLWICPGT